MRPQVGDAVRWTRPSGGGGAGVVKEVIESHWLSGKPAYVVQGNCEYLVVHEIQLVPWEPPWLADLAGVDPR